ncbi:MAG: hypothetical protein DRN54_03915 [Thaumarchaeota archaeon]|nr:MAG: hypothetical protein DRN54_03915 [Nitrososphaerota archaeon]
MPTYLVSLYCPYCLEVFDIEVKAPTAEHAKEKAVGMKVTCPKCGEEFEIQENFLISAYPLKIPRLVLPYKPLPEEKAKELKWLKGAIVEEPLPIGAKPVGSPRLVTTIPDQLTTLIYEQEVKSPEYPEKTWKIKYTRSIYTKFLEEARRMARANKIPEAVLYLVEHCPGITVRQIADVLGIGYWTAYREVAKQAYPTKEQEKTLEKALEEAQKHKPLAPAELEEIKKTFLKPKPAKIIIGGLWRGQLTLYPIKPKTEEELLAELKRILDLEGYMPTPEEWEQMKKQIEKHREAWLKSSIQWWIEQTAKT